MSATPDPGAVPPSPSRPRCLLRRLARIVVVSLALGMLAEIIMVATPIPEHLYAWLNQTQRPEHADAIVCLGGQYERLLWTARSYHQHLAPRVIVSNAPGAAEFMRDMLIVCGVPRKDILVDSTSRTTADHPAGIGQLPGIDLKRDRFLIITNVEHSRRVADVFRKAGCARFSIYGGPLPLDILSGDQRLADGDVVEPIHNHFKWRVQALPRLAYEYTALLQYWLQGKI